MHLISLSVLLSAFSSCEQKEVKTGNTAACIDAEEDSKVISIPELIANKDSYLNREISIATYLFTHEEGAWIADDPNKPLWDSVGLKITEESELIGADPSQFRWWFQYQPGYPIIISGIFRVGDWTAHGQVIRNHEYFEVASAREVSAENKTWKNQINKQVNQAEMATPRKSSDQF